MKSVLDLDTLLTYDRPAPRYTSYPAAPKFGSIDESVFLHRIEQLSRTTDPVSIYIHIPFCKSMCLFCGCSVILNRSEERQARYVASLLKEIDLFTKRFQNKKICTQIHLGGGTPTSLSENEMTCLFERLRESFDLVGEIAIEIDPRTVYADGGAKLSHLRGLGFNRVSFGVQDLDPKVQEAVRRRQSEEMSHQTVLLAKDLGFTGINLDLIYGLPFQTVASFTNTAETIASWRPDRIALFSYAKVPHLKLHQKAIKEETLPSAFEKFQIYLKAREVFLQAGYTQIGMDHFALATDSLSHAIEDKTLSRNFQGYTVQAADDLIQFGVTSIGSLGGDYFQNVKTIEEYETRLTQDRLPVFRGCILTDEDRRRRWVIQSLMCKFEVDKQAFFTLFGHSFDDHFQQERKNLDPTLVEEDSLYLKATDLGQLLIRLVAATFDEHLTSEGSKAI